MSKTINDLRDFSNELHLHMKFHLQIGRWPQEPSEISSFEECEGIPLNVTNYSMRLSNDPFSRKFTIQLLKMDEQLEEMVPFGELEFEVSTQKIQPVERVESAVAKSYFCTYRNINGRKS